MANTNKKEFTIGEIKYKIVESKKKDYKYDLKYKNPENGRWYQVNSYTRLSDCKERAKTHHYSWFYLLKK